MTAYETVIWCPEPESNRYVRSRTADFKSAVSTNFTIGAMRSFCTRKTDNPDNAGAIGVACFWRRGPESNRPTRICNPVHNRFATAPIVSSITLTKKGSLGFPSGWKTLALLPASGAGNEARTRDLNLGKVALYQLSYSRICQQTQPENLVCCDPEIITYFFRRRQVDRGFVSVSPTRSRPRQSPRRNPVRRLRPPPPTKVSAFAPARCREPDRSI